MEVIYNLNSKGKWIKWLHEDKPLSFSEIGRNRRHKLRASALSVSTSLTKSAFLCVLALTAHMQQLLSRNQIRTLFAIAVQLDISVHDVITCSQRSASAKALTKGRTQGLNSNLNDCIVDRRWQLVSWKLLISTSTLLYVHVTAAWVLVFRASLSWSIDYLCLEGLREGVWLLSWEAGFVQWNEGPTWCRGTNYYVLMSNIAEHGNMTQPSTESSL